MIQGLNFKFEEVKEMNKSYKAVSVFSGAGGMDYGMAQAGIEALVAVEIMPEAAQTYRANFPHTRLINEDINNVLDELAQYKGQADIVFGGPPCQGFSVAGKMDPNDNRSQLIFTFLDVVERVQPLVFIMENVKSLGTLEKWSPIRKKYFSKAEELGYAVSMVQTNATDFGVPQKRERVFFIGIKNNTDFFMQQNIESCLAKEKSKSKSVRETLVPLGRAGSKKNPLTCTAKITFATNPVMRKSPYAGMYFNGQGRPINVDEYANTLPASMGGNKTPFLDEDYLFGETQEDWVVSYHKSLMENPIRSIPSEVPKNLRRITIQEAAKLQTFPDHFVWEGSKGKIYTQIGNAVPCNLAKAIGQSVISYLSMHFENGVS